MLAFAPKEEYVRACVSRLDTPDQLGEALGEEHSLSDRLHSLARTSRSACLSICVKLCLPVSPLSYVSEAFEGSSDLPCVASTSDYHTKQKIKI